MQAPSHLNATSADLAGNGAIGRYVLLPGSDGRARQVAENYFNEVRVLSHSRGHNLYLGQLQDTEQPVDVAAISTGMGAASTEIILHELYGLGARRFLRIGTSGSLQPEVKIGDIVVPTAAVRDEGTTCDFVPDDFPAVAHFDWLRIIDTVTQSLPAEIKTHFGIVHCKASLYGRQLGEGPKQLENQRYMTLLKECGVLATEMETSALFALSSVFDHASRAQSKQKLGVLSAAVLAIIGDGKYVPNATESQHIVDNMLALAIASIKTLAKQER